MQKIKNKTILVTGTSGFIGNHLSSYFHKKGFYIIGIGRISKENSNKEDFSIYHQSLNFESIVDILKNTRVDFVLHCAGKSSVPNSFQYPLEDYNSGPNLLILILEAIRLYSPHTKLIFFSSAAVYGNPRLLPISEDSTKKPISPYGYHKYISELLIEEYNRLHNINSYILRLFSAYGPGLRRQVIWDLIYKFLNNSKKIEVHGSGNESRDFIHIIDICRAVELLIKQNKDELLIFNLANGVQIQINELVNIIKEKLSNDTKIIYTNKNPNGNPTNWCADIKKIQLEGFQPSVSLSDGIKNYIDWYKLNKISIYN